MTDQTPQPWIVEHAIEEAGFSPCRSKRGVVIFDAIDGNVVARGHNRKSECDGSAACKATCRVDAVHAEQCALLFAGCRARGADMLHVKAVDGALVVSGGPSCVECSKLARQAGIAGVWLYHAEGWKRYPIEEFHALSVAAHAADAARLAAQAQDHKVLMAAADETRKIDVAVIERLQADNAALRAQVETLTKEKAKAIDILNDDIVGMGDVVKQLRADLSTLRDQLAQQGWQPIETAPKDGTEICCAEFDDGGQWPDSARWTFWPDHWRQYLMGGEGFGAWPPRTPTHWMPLPAPHVLASPDTLEIT